MRTYRRLRVQLSRQDEKELRGLLQGGIQQVRVVLRALVLRDRVKINWQFTRKKARAKFRYKSNS